MSIIRDTNKIDTTKYEVFSFDIFDTLIYRYVSKPKDIFSLVEQAYKKNWGGAR